MVYNQPHLNTPPCSVLFHTVPSNVCVMDMDHHCPFVATCVGRGNLRSFLHFTGYTVLAMAFCAAHTGAMIYSRKRCVLGCACVRLYVGVGRVGGWVGGLS
jgi:hypothetical protein